VGTGRHPAIHHLADRLDFVWRHVGPSVPSVTENAHEAPRLANFSVAAPVERVVEEEVAREHRNPDAMAKVSASGPHLDRRQKRMKPLRRELVVHELLAMAPRPEDEPSGLGDRRSRCVIPGDPGSLFLLHHDIGQGFAPFGRRPVRAPEPTRAVRVSVRITSISILRLCRISPFATGPTLTPFARSSADPRHAL